MSARILPIVNGVKFSILTVLPFLWLTSFASTDRAIIRYFYSHWIISPSIPAVKTVSVHYFDYHINNKLINIYFFLLSHYAMIMHLFFFSTPCHLFESRRNCSHLCYTNPLLLC